MELGEKIANIRERKDISMTELAKKANISVSYLNDIEKGRSNPSLDTLKSIAKALNMPAGYFLDDPPGIATEAAHRTDDPMDELPEEARKSIEEFKQYIYNKYRKK